MCIYVCTYTYLCMSTERVWEQPHPTIMKILPTKGQRSHMSIEEKPQIQLSLGNLSNFSLKNGFNLCKSHGQNKHVNKHYISTFEKCIL